MTVSVRYAPTSLGVPFSLPESMGILSPGEEGEVKDVYISHTGTNSITLCELYILPYAAGVYLGTNTAQDDYELQIEWGDAYYASSGDGGLFLNTNHVGGFPTEDWEVIRTGYGDSLGTAITLPSAALNIGSGDDGEIPAGGDAHIRWKWVIPSTYSTPGTIYWDTFLSFSATS